MERNLGQPTDPLGPPQYGAGLNGRQRGGRRANTCARLDRWVGGGAFRAFGMLVRQRRREPRRELDRCARFASSSQAGHQESRTARAARGGSHLHRRGRAAASLAGSPTARAGESWSGAATRLSGRDLDRRCRDALDGSHTWRHGGLPARRSDRYDPIRPTASLRRDRGGRRSDGPVAAIPPRSTTSTSERTDLASTRLDTTRLEITIAAGGTESLPPFSHDPPLRITPPAALVAAGRSRGSPRRCRAPRRRRASSSRGARRGAP